LFLSRVVSASDERHYLSVPRFRDELSWPVQIFTAWGCSGKKLVREYCEHRKDGSREEKDNQTDARTRYIGNSRKLNCFVMTLSDCQRIKAH
jgi:hypothetical protein